VVAGGATLPLTLPVYAKAAFGALVIPKGIDFFNEQRLKRAQGTLAYQTAQSLPSQFLVNQKMEEEIQKLKSEKKQMNAEALKAAADALKARIEALAVFTTLDTGGKTTEETDRFKAEIDKLRADILKELLELGDKFVEPSAEWPAPPSSNVPIPVIDKVADKHQLPSPIVAVAINAGAPVLAEAEAAGVRVSLDTAA
jgi:hypothetical protein